MRRLFLGSSAVTTNGIATQLWRVGFRAFAMVFVALDSRTGNFRQLTSPRIVRKMRAAVLAVFELAGSTWRSATAHRRVADKSFASSDATQASAAYADMENRMRNGRATEQAQDDGAGDWIDSPAQPIPVCEAGLHDKEAEGSQSWKIEVVVDDSGEWESDPFRFETVDEALAYARDLEFRWAAVRDWRVVKSPDPVNQSRPRTNTGRDETTADAPAAPGKDGL
jgi:hypothetical protein